MKQACLVKIVEIDSFCMPDPPQFCDVLVEKMIKVFFLGKYLLLLQSNAEISDLK